jgi:hypothetical protein
MDIRFLDGWVIGHLLSALCVGFGIEYWICVPSPIHPLLFEKEYCRT